MAVTDAVRISVGEESTFGTSPDETVMQTLRYTAEDLKSGRTVESSDEIDSTGIPPDAVVTGVNAGGSISGYLSAPDLGTNGVVGQGNWDRLFEGALYAGTDLETEVKEVSDITADETGGVYKYTRAGDWNITTYAAGRWARASGFSESGNNGYFKISSLDNVPDPGEIYTTSRVLVDDADGTIEPSHFIEIGTNVRSYTIERYHSDITYGATKDRSVRYTGFIPTGIELSMNNQGPISVRIPGISKFETRQADQIGAAAPIAATTGKVLGGLNVAAVLEGDGANYVTPVDCVQGFSLSYSNGARLVECGDSVDPVEPARGALSLTGSISFGLNDDNLSQHEAMINRYLSGGLTAIAFVIWDANERGWIFEIPEVRFSEGDSSTPGKGRDVVVELGFTAKKEPSTSDFFNIMKFDGY